MRLRLTVLACALTALGCVLAPGSAGAAPRHNDRLTIASAPNPVSAGEGVLIYGRLFGSQTGGQTIRLYHHVIGSGQGYRLVGTTTTNGSGFYEFNTPESGIYTNRNWFARGPEGAHSRTVHERVSPLVAVNASTTSTDTNHLVVFTGHVTPNHAFERVFLQQRIGSSDDFRTLRSTFLDGSSNYTIPYRWRRPDVHDVRVLFRGDWRNTRGVSDVVTVNIEQAQVPGFTINSSAPIVDYNGSTTISGTLSSVTTPQVVQLWARHPGDGRFSVIADRPTDANGNYSFTQSGLTTNTVYYVATMKLPQTTRRHSAVLFQGVRDAVAMQASSSEVSTNQPVTFTGTVLPDKSGRLIYLQKRGKDGDWHTVETGIVRFGSTFQFRYTIGNPGTRMFRARITSDGVNVGSASAPVSVTATAPAASALSGAS